MVVRTERGRIRKGKRNGRLVGAAEISKEHAQKCRLQRKNLSTLGQPKIEGWPQCHRESSLYGKYPGVTVAKRKKNKAGCPEHHILRWDRVKMSESRSLTSERGLELEHVKEMVDSAGKEGRFHGGEGR